MSARLVSCLTCDGCGYVEMSPHGYDHVTGDLLVDLRRCPDCDGCGLIEVEDEPATPDDLEDDEP
jgi:hypothetical protein